MDAPPPSLLDRLADDDPSSRAESAAAAHIAARRMREILRRDIAAILGAIRLSDVVDLGDRPRILNSVLNFGVCDFSGRSADQIDPGRIATELREAILAYEPRIRPDTLKVDVEPPGEGDRRGVVGMSVEGVYEAAGETVSVSAEIHLETGAVYVLDVAGEGR